MCDINKCRKTNRKWIEHDKTKNDNQIRLNIYLITARAYPGGPDPPIEMLFQFF